MMDPSVISTETLNYINEVTILWLDEMQLSTHDIECNFAGFIIFNVSQASSQQDWLIQSFWLRIIDDQRLNKPIWGTQD